MALSQKKSNKLSMEMSPYLKRSSTSEVFWYPWGEEAFERAKNEDKAIFLNIGYTACHWCNRMEKESFSDSQVAAFLNEHFICIKVDKEERPDIDEVYMGATMIFNGGQAGWPMNLFLEYGGKPFASSSYVPLHDQDGRWGFFSIINWAADQWRSNRQILINEANLVKDSMEKIYSKKQEDILDPSYFDFAVKYLELHWDQSYGGFQQKAPKFFSPSTLQYLMNRYEDKPSEQIKEMLLKTLSHMVKGGVYDLIAGGFSRYSTDREWLVPHFEKMLYDNATLLGIYARAASLFKEPLFKAVSFDIATFILSDMLASETGGFVSSIDANLGDKEGVYYSFSYEELEKEFPNEELSSLGESLELSQEGNFNGAILPTLSVAHELDNSSFIEVLSGKHQAFLKHRQKLLEYRAYRHKVSKDYKVLLGWNSLVISAFISVYHAFGEGRFLGLAMEQARFLEKHFKSRNSYHRCFMAGKSYGKASLEDLAYLCRALLDLYQATLKVKYLEEARSIKNTLLKDFYSEKNFWFQSASTKEEKLFVSAKEASDPVIANPALVAFECLLFFSHEEKNDNYREKVNQSLYVLARHAKRLPAVYLGYYNLLLSAMTPALEVSYQGTAEDEIFIRLNQWGLQNKWVPIIVSHKSSNSAQITIKQKGAELLQTNSLEKLDEFLTNYKSVLVSLREFEQNQEASSKQAQFKQYFKQFPDIQNHFFSQHNWQLSRVGMGAYRVQNQEDDIQMLTQVASSGINVFDTSNNYYDGESELAIGKAISKLQSEKKFKREDFILLSKAGYIQGDLLELKKLLTSDIGTVKLSDDHWHCIDPKHLGEEIQKTKDRLNVKKIDGFFLHNPEYLLEELGQDEFYQKIQKSFEFLEAKVKQGEIGFYGVSSNTMAKVNHRLFVDVRKMMEVATNSLGIQHHFRLLQFPFNLLESEAYTSNEFHGNHLFHYCKQHQIAAFTNRPLNAIFNDRLVRLASVKVPDERYDYDKEYMKLQYLENIWRSKIAPNIKAEGLKQDLKELFTVSEAVKEQLQDCYSEEHWQRFETHIFDYALHNLNFFDKHLEAGDPQLWLDFRTDFISTLQNLCEECRRRVLMKNYLITSNIEKVFDKYLSDDRRSLPLSIKSLWLINHVSELASILNGIRRADYLQEVKQMLSLPLELPLGKILKEISQIETFGSQEA